jgi:hypothetical protein
MRKNCIDETRKQYGSLTVLEFMRTKDNRAGWLCQCNCGNKKVVRGTDLRSGKITTCG